MISQKSIDELRQTQTLDWITALKSAQIRALLEDGTVQLGLFDERNLFELTHPEFPGERLIACRNAQLAEFRAHKRQALLQATAAELEKVRSMVARKRLRGADQIGVRVGRVVNKYKVAKHFELEIEDERCSFRIREEQVAAEGLLDGIYILRTPVAEDKMDAAQVVRSYKSLAPGRAGVSLIENSRPQDPADSPSARRSSKSPHLSVHACLLRRVAYAGGMAGTALCRRRSTRQTEPRPGRPGRALSPGRAQGLDSHPRQWLART